MKYICTECEKKFVPSPSVWKCDCGAPFMLSEYPKSFPTGKTGKRRNGFWKYKEALPFDSETQKVSLRESVTPLVEDNFGGGSVFLKRESELPSGSFKDRGAAVILTKAREMGVKEVVEDSSGNAGCAISLYATEARMDCRIFVPENTQKQTIEYMKNAGAEVIVVEGDRGEASKRAAEEAGETFYASHIWNPYFLEGTKTCAFEIVEQLGWLTTERIYLPVGNGTLLIGLYLGLKDLQENGIITNIPTLCAVQQEGWAPLYEEIHGKKVPEKKNPTAKGIAIKNPPRLKQMKRIIRDTGGEIIKVSGKKIKKAHSLLNDAHYNVELTGSTGFAGFLKSEKTHSTVILTG